MASRSVCPNQSCKSTTFEVATESIRHANFKLSFIRCYSCGTVVGVTEYYNIGERLDKLAKKLGTRLD